MKNNPYKRPPTPGIRIPKHKIKWMRTPEDETTEPMDISLHSGRPPINLYIRNLNLLLQKSDDQEPAKVIDVTDCQGGENHDA